ncbi:MAG: BREX-1 system phosphatase PglZ type B [Methylococcaceae bacterium]|nr:BREX-1 system phosphatase PglZ type B [Methylococcaceae bacterium]
MLIIDHLVNSIKEANKYNSNVQVPPAAVLWTDKERQWEAVINKLQALLPELIILGDYAPKQMTGPVIWIKCVLAGTLPEIILPEASVPIIYLPGVSRSDLRAIESCPVWLQGLAELQYRGVFWSQTNGRDWTVNAFLTSHSGGLGLEVAKDDKTQNALLRVLETLLFDKKVAELTGSHLESNDFNQMLMSAPDKDLLTWMNDPQAVKAQWQGARWDAFVELTAKEFGLNPDKEGDLGAAEALCKNEGAWRQVWQRFVETCHLYPKLSELLERVSVHADLFVDQSTYVQYTISQEKALASSLLKATELTPAAARSEILSLEAHHAERRDWVWVKMGYAPMVVALEHLAVIAQLAQTIPGGLTPEEMGASYQERYWQVDLACLAALSSVSSPQYQDVIKRVLSTIYTPWLSEMNQVFQSLVSAKGYPGSHQVNEAVAEYQVNGECVFFIDGLRFDIAHSLVNKLNTEGFNSDLSSNWSALPTVTATAKAAVTPIHQLITGRTSDSDFQPSLLSDDKPHSQYYLKKLLEAEGWQYIPTDETGDATGKAWTEYGDIDKEGHVKQLKLAQRIEPLLEEIVGRIVELESAGWRKFRLVTDHGWLLVPDQLPKVNLPKHLTETHWGRCAQLKETVSSNELVLGWHWNQEVSIAMAPAICSFVAGKYYEHGGVSLQECLTPVINVLSSASQLSKVTAVIKSKKWLGFRCKIEVQTEGEVFAVLRTKPADETSNISDKKKVVSGKCTLMVEDDELEGSSGVLVLLDAEGQLLDKQATIVAE